MITVVFNVLILVILAERSDKECKLNTLNSSCFNRRFSTGHRNHTQQSNYKNKIGNNAFIHDLIFVNIANKDSVNSINLKRDSKFVLFGKFSSWIINQ